MSEPLAQLAWEKKWAALNAALHSGRDPNAAAELYDWGLGKCSPLLLTAYKGAPRSTVELLAAKGADVGWANEVGRTAFHQAAESGLAEVVRALGGTHGAALDVQDNDGRTPLHFAAQHGKPAAARALVELGADASLRMGTARPRWSGPRRWAGTRPRSCYAITRRRRQCRQVSRRG